MRQLKDKIMKAVHTLFVKNEKKKKRYLKNVRHAKEMFNAFFNLVLMTCNIFAGKKWRGNKVNRNFSK